MDLEQTAGKRVVVRRCAGYFLAVKKKIYFVAIMPAQSVHKVIVIIPRVGGKEFYTFDTVNSDFFSNYQYAFGR